jgi:hypothetical protein
MSSLLVFSRDPGPTNQLVAVVEQLTEPPAANEPSGLVALRAATASVIGRVQIASRGPGIDMWRESGREVSVWEGLDEHAAMELIVQCGAGAVLTGTSDVDEPADRALWRAARARAIASHVVLDHPANLAQRFRDADGTLVLPDWLYVTDDMFAERLAVAGVPRERIRLIGDLHHARLRRLAADVTAAEVREMREMWGASPATTVVMFVSECGREMVRAGRPTHYDEIEALERLFDELRRGKLPDGGAIDPTSLLVIVRPHPRDAAGKYDGLIAARRTPRAVVSAQGSPHVALIASDLVVGMNSSLLYEALEIGRPVWSLTGHDLSAGKSSVL